MNAERGSSLVEAIIAALILVTGVLGMVQLFSIAIASNVAARHRTIAMVLAGQKVEELRANPLANGTSGAVEYLSASGAVVGRGSPPPSSAVYTRRWTIEPAGSGVILEVRVFVKGSRVEEAHLLTMQGPRGE